MGRSTTGPLPSIDLGHSGVSSALLRRDSVYVPSTFRKVGADFEATRSTAAAYRLRYAAHTRGSSGCGPERHKKTTSLH